MKVEFKLEQDIRLKIFELRHTGNHQYVDEHEKGVIEGKIAVYEEWLEYLSESETNNLKKEHVG